MGWVKRAPIPHDCRVPPPPACKGLGPGSIWECDECGLQWETLNQDGWNWRSLDQFARPSRTKMFGTR